MHRLIIILLVISYPLMSFAALLRSIGGSEKSQKDFAIVTLQFDQTVPYTFSQVEAGRALELCIPDCKLDLEVREHISKLSNKFISEASFRTGEDTLHLEFKFTERMKVAVWETDNPFVLVLDISNAETTPVKQQRSESRQKPGPKPAESESKPLKVAKKEEPKPVKPPPNSIVHKDRLNIVQQEQSKQDLSAEMHFEQGLSLVEDGKLKEALDHFKAVQQDSDYVYKVTVEIASIYHQLGLVDEEVREWETLLAALKAKGFSPASKLLSKDASSDGGDLAGSSLSGMQNHTDSQVRVAGSRGLLFYLMLIAIMLLAGAFVWLLKLVFRLRKEISMLIQETEIDGDTESETESGKDLSSKTSSVADGKSSPENLTTQKKKDGIDVSTSEETAMEVISLSEQGFSIQEIAEKLELGQDEVRLILNLQREEKEYTEKS